MSAPKLPPGSTLSARAELLKAIEASAPDAFLIRPIEITIRTSSNEKLGTITLGARGTARASATYQLTTGIAPKEEGAKLPKAPALIWEGFARLIMSPTQFRKVCEPHIADMEHEYFECLNKGDKVAARWAVIRAHFYAIPGWLYGVIGTILWRIAEWLKA
jgi:hypothetical protein